jgi:hypothetical protein
MSFDLKKALLNLAEENAKTLTKDVVRPLIEQAIKDSKNQIDDLALPYLDQIQTVLLSYMDKIDGEVG